MALFNKFTIYICWLPRRLMCKIAPPNALRGSLLKEKGCCRTFVVDHHLSPVQIKSLGLASQDQTLLFSIRPHPSIQSSFIVFIIFQGNIFGDKKKLLQKSYSSHGLHPSQKFSERNILISFFANKETL